MMCLGHVLLEEHTPHGSGNHAVIITEPQEELMTKVKNLLETIGYVGFSNFDINTIPVTTATNSLRSTPVRDVPTTM